MTINYHIKSNQIKSQSSKTQISKNYINKLIKKYGKDDESARDSDSVGDKKVETCNTTDLMRKSTTCRIQSHIRHVVYRRFTVYDPALEVVYRRFTVIYSGRCGSHIVVCPILNL